MPLKKFIHNEFAFRTSPGQTALRNKEYTVIDIYLLAGPKLSFTYLMHQMHGASCFSIVK